MSTNSELDNALDLLRKGGHKIETNPGAFVHSDGRMRIPIDGRALTYEEIFQMANDESAKSAE